MATAFFTIAQDELDLMPLWLAHYRAYAPEAQLYVLNHDSIGDAEYFLASAQSDGVHVIPVHHAESFDYNWLTRTVEDFAAFLLRSYDVVGFSEVDELLLPRHGSYKTLDELVENVPDVFIRATGWCVVHHHQEEPDLDWTRPILAQRLHWYQSQRYSKVAFMRRRVYYHDGFHGAYNVPESLEPHPDLLCLHLHQADYQTALRRHQRNGGRFWSAEHRRSPQGVHQRLEDPAGLEKYLLCDLDNPTEYAKFDNIPAEYKESYRVCLPTR